MTTGRRQALKAGLGAAMAGMAAAPAIVRAQTPLKLPLSTAWPDGNFHVVNARRFAEDGKKATGGAVEIDVKSGGQLGFKGPEHLRAVRDGLVPMADILDVQQVFEVPHGRLGKAIADSSLGASSVREVLGNLAGPLTARAQNDLLTALTRTINGNFRREPDRPNKTYSRMIGSIFVDPLIDSGSASSQLFSWNAQAVADIGAMTEGKLGKDFVQVQAGRPGDRQIRIVPCDAAFGRGIVWRRHLVGDHRIGLQGHEAVGEAFGHEDLPAIAGPLDGRSLLPHLSGAPGHDEAAGEYLAEGAIAPIVMIRRGRHKFICSPADPDQLFDLASDPHERANLAGDPASAGLAGQFRREIAARWDLQALDREVRHSQRRRIAVENDRAEQDDRVGVERHAARQESIQDDAERPDVGARVDVPRRRELLGRHVRNGPDDHLSLGRAPLARRHVGNLASHTEVENLQHAAS